jgi:hypothetical protein
MKLVTSTGASTVSPIQEEMFPMVAVAFCDFIIIGCNNKINMATLTLMMPVENLHLFVSVKKRIKPKRGRKLPSSEIY